MNDPAPAPAPSQTPIPGADPLALIRSEQSFQRLVLLATIVALILISTGVNLFLLRQISLARRQADEFRAIVQDYEANNLPVMNKFVSDLRIFTASHPDFAPILAKYVQQSPGPSSNTPPALPPRTP
jgi:hypothetical protein